MKKGKLTEDFNSISEENYAQYPVNTNRWANFFLVDHVTVFGRKGGFDLLIDYLKQEDPKPPMALVSTVLEVFWHVSRTLFGVFSYVFSVVNFIW